ncbi:MAG: FliA/WhiG family RNA polymerase sigma factor [Fibrobacter sp.]|nr:FliA/WhiG family RNA polymerase sigma factor [Fibrobacter sp.]
MDLAELWTQYKEGNSLARDKLLAEYLPLVKYTAHRMAVNLPKSVDVDDLIGTGVFGLMRALETFDISLGYKFETFATHRVRGAILDELRARDWVPRSIRQKSRRIQKAMADLEHSLGRMPYDEEVATELGINMDEYDSMLAEVAPTTMVSLDQTFHDGGGDSKSIRLIDTIEDPDGTDPLKEISFEETKNILKDSIANLPERERLIIALYHYEELTLKEIGSVLDISESRVSQIHSKAMLKLRAKVIKASNR